MKRIFVIRRRRYLARAISLGFAVALLLPTAALARYDERGTGAVVLPAAEQKAVEQAVAKGGAVQPTVSAPSAAADSTVAWGRIALFSSLGLLGIAGLLMLAALANRRGVRVAHS
jgi:hypothetical protein